MSLRSRTTQQMGHVVSIDAAVGLFLFWVAGRCKMVCHCFVNSIYSQRLITPWRPMPKSSDRVLALSTRYVRFMAPARFESL